ncbi:MAG: hypothetical protein ABL884_13210 [Methyloglobulus sp.]
MPRSLSQNAAWLKNGWVMDCVGITYRPEHILMLTPPLYNLGGV